MFPATYALSASKRLKKKKGVPLPVIHRFHLSEVKKRIKLAWVKAHPSSATNFSMWWFGLFYYLNAFLHSHQFPFPSPFVP